MHITKRDFLKLNFLQKEQLIWERWCGSDFSSVWSALPCCFSKSPLEREILDIYLTTFFGVPNFGNRSAVRIIFFFWKYSKLNLDFKNEKANWKKNFCFCCNCIWICCLKLSLLRREYLSSHVIMLRNIIESLSITKRDFLQLNCLHSDQ